MLESCISMSVSGEVSDARRRTYGEREQRRQRRERPTRWGGQGPGPSRARRHMRMRGTGDVLVGHYLRHDDFRAERI